MHNSFYFLYLFIPKKCALCRGMATMCTPSQVRLYMSVLTASTAFASIRTDGKPCNHRALRTRPAQKGTNGRRKHYYLYFRDAWGYHISILVSRAVYLAWCGPIEEGMTIDHINGCAINNDYRNFRQVSGAINKRDGGFLGKLKKVGIDPQTLQRWMILRYFDRMAEYKQTHTAAEYKNLSVEQLKHILYDNN